MVLTLPVVFPHRQNRDGSFDSICRRCLLTVANTRNEADLTEHEKYHVCNPSILFQRTFDRVHEVLVLRMKYLADYVVSHRGNKHSGCVVLPKECVPRVGDVLFKVVCFWEISAKDCVSNRAAKHNAPYELGI